MKTFRHFFLLLFLITFSDYLFSQRTAQQIVDQSEIQCSNYTIVPGKMDVLTIPMAFGESSTLNAIERETIQLAKVKQVHVVFTDFPKDADLKALNKSRIKVVEGIRKNLVTDTTIQWKVIRQTNCKTEEEAKQLFHGIVIFYEHESFLVEKATISTLLPETVTPREGKKLIKEFEDTTTYHVLNKMNWNNMAIVTDFTSSMYPYSAQVILWFAINTQQSKITDVYFFNDGDSKLDTKKVIGETGGIYHEHNVNFKEIRKLAFKTASKGIGGNDLEENDLEAVLSACKNSSDAKGIVLIADNNAPPRDMALLSKIKKPVHVILCGTNKGNIELAYLQIAKKTGGSIHTMEESLTELAKLKEGQTIQFGDKSYKIIQGNVVEIKSVK
ncbi:MAG: hypothetical protein RIT43_1057 [Bacteroidota bacterium]